MQRLQASTCNRSVDARIPCGMEGAPDKPDRELVDAVLTNRPGAFEHMVREYQGLCWHIVQRMVRNPEDAR